MISGGVVHQVPADLKKALTSNPQALTAWEDITPLVAVIGPELEEFVFRAMPLIDHFLHKIFVLVQSKPKWSLVALATCVTPDEQLHSHIFAQNQDPRGLPLRVANGVSSNKPTAASRESRVLKTAAIIRFRDVSGLLRLAHRSPGVV